MNKLEKLMADHAYWTAERKRLKEEGSEEYSKCERANSPRYGWLPTCLQHAYSEWQTLHKDNPFDQYQYDEILEEEGYCTHCQRTRELKRQRAIAGQRLGAVRSAITRIGNRLLNEEATK